MKDEFLVKAKELNKKKKFRDALNILFQIWRNDKSPDIAIEILKGLKFHPNKTNTDKWLAVFEKEFIKNPMILEQISEFKFVKQLNELNKLNDMAKKIELADQLIANKNYNQNQINTVLVRIVRSLLDNDLNVKSFEYFDRINEDLLLFETDHKKSNSEHKRYIQLKIDLYKRLNKKLELLETYKNAIISYPEINAYKRDYINLLINSDKLEEAEKVINDNINWNRPIWAIIELKAKLLYLKGEYNEAWKYATKAFLTKGEQKYKTDLHIIIANIADKLNKKEISNDFKILTFLIRSLNKLSIPDDIVNFVKTIKETDLTVDKIINRNIDEIEKGEYIDKTFYEGKIVWFPLDKNFVRVKYNSNKNIIIYKKDLSIDCQYEGASISFVLDKTVDKKTKDQVNIGKFGRRLHKI